MFSVAQHCGGSKRLVVLPSCTYCCCGGGGTKRLVGILAQRCRRSKRVIVVVVAITITAMPCRVVVILIVQSFQQGLRALQRRRRLLVIHVDVIRQARSILAQIGLPCGGVDVLLRRFQLLPWHCNLDWHQQCSRRSGVALPAALGRWEASMPWSSLHEGGKQVCADAAGKVSVAAGNCSVRMRLRASEQCSLLPSLVGCNS